MMRRLKTLAVLAAVHVTLVLTALPVFAAEEGGESSGKISLPSTPRDIVGLFIIGFILVVAAVALFNASKNLRGERPQATGRIRWR